MQINFGAFHGAPRSYGAPQRDLCGFEAARLKAENTQLRAQNQRLQSAVVQRNQMLKQVASRLRRPQVQAPRSTAQRAPAMAPQIPRSAPAPQVTVPIRQTAPQVLETDRDFTQPTDDALARAWYGGHLGGTGYDGLESPGVGLEDALGLDG